MIDRTLPPSPAPAPPSAASVLARVPPHSLDAERALLASIFLDPDVLGGVIPLVKPDDFYRSAHQQIFSTCVALYDRGEPADPLLVLRECERAGTLEAVGGREALASLAGAAATAANAEHYARIVREKAIARGLIRVTADLQRAAYEDEGRGEDLLDRAEHEVFSLARSEDLNQATSVGTLLHDVLGELESREGAKTGVPTGFFYFDELTGGFHAGELIIVAGRPSMGKTTFALNVAYHAATKARVPTAIFSMEMSKQQITKNILCAHAKVEARNLRSGRFLSDDDYARLSNEASRLYETPIFIDDSPGLSTTALRAKARRLKQKHDVGLLVVDYLQLMEAIGVSSNVESRQQEISYISRSLKGLARELSVPVVAISQLNRAADAREDHRPRLSDLRESGALEQDADLICFLFRKHYYSKAESDRGLAEVIVAKQRNGPTDTVKLAFVEQFMLFDNLAIGTATPPA